MKKIHRGILLILIMFGHNFVLNQAQTLQNEIQDLHQVNVPEFNFLYSIPSAVSIFFIIPLGILYDKYSQGILLFASFMLIIGQIIVTIFGPSKGDFHYQLFVGGRIFQGVGAEVLYMIQGNLASTWMGSMAGITFILPEIGQIGNVFITPYVSEKHGIFSAFAIGLICCTISFISCMILYFYLQVGKKKKKMFEMDMIEYQEELTKPDIIKQSYEKGNEKIWKETDIKQKNHKNFLKLQNLQEQEPKNILTAGQIFWLMIALCAINECLYFPFLDNANVLIQNRFCVEHSDTGFFLCLPFISAIITTAILGINTFESVPKKNLIFYASLFPFLGHLLIYLNENCQGSIQLMQKIFLFSGFWIFGMGLGSYYSISFSAVGLAVPQSIRGAAYGCLCFFQTLSMTAVPIISGVIIEKDSENNDNFIKGYKNSSFLFVCMSLVGVAISTVIMIRGKDDSFKYDDEKKSEDEDEKEQLKSTYTNQE